MFGEAFVATLPAGDDVVLSSADGAFSGIHSVLIGRRGLEIDVFLLKIPQEDVGGFVVKPL